MPNAGVILKRKISLPEAERLQFPNEHTPIMIEVSNASDSATGFINADKAAG